MASKRIDELTTRAVVNTDLLPPTPTGGPSGSATVAATVKAGLVQPNSGTAGAGADVTIKAADGVTSGAGGNIILQPGVQATTGGNGIVKVKASGGSQTLSFYATTGNTYINSSEERLQLTSTGYIHFNCQQMYFCTYHYLSSTYFQLANNHQIFFNWGQSFQYPYTDSGIGRANHGLLKITCGGHDYNNQGGSIAYKAATSSISSDQDNYALPASAFQRLNCTVVSNVTGIAPPATLGNGSPAAAHVDGRMIKVFNVGTASLTLKHNSTSSSAANRMFSVSGSDIVLGTNDYAECVYDSTDNGSGAAGWRIA